MTATDTETPKSATHTFHGTPCEKCDRTHDLFLSTEEMPPKVAADLSTLLDHLPDRLVDKAIVAPRQDIANMVDSFFQFSKIVQRMNANGPLLLAIAEVLDEQTDGAVRRRYAVTVKEQSVVTARTLRKVLMDFCETLEQKVSNIPPQVKEALEHLEHETNRILNEMVEQYSTTCMEKEIPADEGILGDNHLPSEERFFARRVLDDQLRYELDVASDRAHHHHDGDEETDDSQ